LLLFIAALAVRVFRFGNVPGGFNQDEAMAAYEALSLSLYGTDRFGMSFPVYFTGWGFAQMNVLLSYAMVPFIRLFGLSAVTARLPMLIAGMLGLYSLYRFTDAVSGKYTAWAVLAFAACSPWHIMHSRWALESNLFPHLLMVGGWLLYDGINRKPYKLYLSMMVFGLAMYAYGIAFITVPLLLLIYTLYLLKKDTVNRKKILIGFAVYMSVAWPVFLLMFINYFNRPSVTVGLITIPYFPYGNRMGDLLFFSEGFIRQLTDNAAAFLRVVLLQGDYAPWNTVPRYGMFYAWGMPFIVAGIVFIFTQIKKPPMVYILCWLGTACLTGLLINYVNLTRVNIIMYPLLFAGGLGIAWMVRLPLRLTTTELQAKIKNGRFSILYIKDDRKAKRLSHITVTAVTFILVISFIGFNHTYFRRHNDYLSHAFYRDFYAGLDYASTLEWDKLYVTAWTQHTGRHYVSEILTLYGLQIDPLLYQNKEKYHERYFYMDFTRSPPIPDLNAVYVFNENERVFFPDNRFRFHSFGDFGVAVPRYD
jgi:hypothetical protein